MCRKIVVRTSVGSLAKVEEDWEDPDAARTVGGTKKGS